jgi:hypothetical protein
MLGNNLRSSWKIQRPDIKTLWALSQHKNKHISGLDILTDVYSTVDYQWLKYK